MSQIAVAVEEPPERSARAPEWRAGQRIAVADHTGDPAVAVTLAAWLEGAKDVERRSLSPLTRARLGDWRRITGELHRVLAGLEEGEGESSDRLLIAAHAGGRVQAVAAVFACPGATFIELLATAPWNLLGPDDPRDLRTVRGAGTAILAHAAAASAIRGAGGAVALQAENPRTLAFYERLGFRRMTAADRPLALIPRRAAGWSAPVARLAAGEPAGDEADGPWLVLPPGAAAARLAG
jgi:hypothetical protein